MTNLKDMVSPIARFSYFCTLAPFVVVKNKKEFAPIGNRPFYLIRMIVKILLLEALYVQSQQYIEPPKQMNEVVIGVIHLCVFYVMHISFPVYLIATFLNSWKIAEFMNNLKQITTQMGEIGLRLNYRRKYKLHLFRVACGVLQMFFSSACFIVEVSNGDAWQIIALVVFTLPFMMTYVILIQWMAFVSLLTMHFKSLNQFLKSLKYRQCFIVEDFPKIERKPLIEVIEECGSIYDKLCDEAKTLNEAYAWQILCLIPHYFLITLSNLYQVLLGFKNDTPFSWQVLINGALGAIYLLEFVVPCAVCKEEASRFSEILNKIDLKLQKNGEIEDVVSCTPHLIS